MRVVLHENRWHWGRKTTIVMARGLALCEVSVEDDDHSVAYLSDVIVHESARRNGYGNRLLKEAVSVARKMGAKKLYLWVYPDAWMRGWYERRGFKFSHYDVDNNACLIMDL